MMMILAKALPFENHCFLPRVLGLVMEKRTKNGQSSHALYTCSFWTSLAHIPGFPDVFTIPRLILAFAHRLLQKGPPTNYAKKILFSLYSPGSLLTKALSLFPCSTRSVLTTVMCCLTMGLSSEICVIKQCCESNIDYTYTNLDGIINFTPRVYYNLMG